MLASFMSLYIPPVLIVLGVSGSGKIAAVDGCIIGTLNTTAAVAGGGGSTAQVHWSWVQAGDGSQSVTADGSPHLSSPASTHPVSSLSTSITSVGH